MKSFTGSCTDSFTGAFLAKWTNRKTNQIKSVCENGNLRLFYVKTVKAFWSWDVWLWKTFFLLLRLRIRGDIFSFFTVWSWRSCSSRLMSRSEENAGLWRDEGSSLCFRQGHRPQNSQFCICEIKYILTASVCIVKHDSLAVYFSKHACWTPTVVFDKAKQEEQDCLDPLRKKHLRWMWKETNHHAPLDTTLSSRNNLTCS